jgi:5'-nucleotidase
MLTIAVSSRALFHIEDGDQLFKEKGQDEFDAYMRSKEHDPLRPGVAFGLVKKLLALNTNAKGQPRNRVDVVVLSRNSPDAGLRVMESVHHHGLDIERGVFCSGGNRFRYAKAIGAHLFLSANPQDVAAAIANGVAAATMLPREADAVQSDAEVKIAFDGDSVLFSSEADEIYQAHGLDAFRQGELDNANVPLGAGPFKPFLDALVEIQKEFPAGKAPLKLALVTARGMPSHARVIRTLRSWGVYMDEAIFAGGKPKGPLLRAFGADMFFDDTMKNVDSAHLHDVTSGHVPFGTGHGIVATPPREQFSGLSTVTGRFDSAIPQPGNAPKAFAGA